jgi:hypothetical protein
MDWINLVQDINNYEYLALASFLIYIKWWKFKWVSDY